MTMVDVLTPMAAEAGPAPLVPLWQVIVFGFFALAALTMTLVVWAVLRLTRQRR